MHFSRCLKHTVHCLEWVGWMLKFLYSLFQHVAYHIPLSKALLLILRGCSFKNVQWYTIHLPFTGKAQGMIYERSPQWSGKIKNKKEGSIARHSKIKLRSVLARQFNSRAKWSLGVEKNIHPVSRQHESGRLRFWKDIAWGTEVSLLTLVGVECLSGRRCPACEPSYLQWREPPPQRMGSQGGQLPPYRAQCI